jgi:hypothetical protein
MLNLASLFNFGKKDNGPVNKSAPPAAESAAPVQAEPNRTDCIPPLPPLDKDTMGGEAEITYESMNGKTRSHYTQIFIDPGSLPIVTGSAKPGNNEYLDVKHELLTKAYGSLRGYPDFVQSLKGMHGRKDLARVMEVIVKRFLMRFWDLRQSLSLPNIISILCRCLYKFLS